MRIVVRVDSWSIARNQVGAREERERMTIFHDEVHRLAIIAATMARPRLGDVPPGSAKVGMEGGGVVEGRLNLVQDVGK